MKDHAQFADDLALYAMGALDARECPELQAHLGTCGECRRELEALRADLAMVALSASGSQPPQRSRQRLMSALAGEPREQHQPGPRLVTARQNPRWFRTLPVVAALALAILCIGLIVQVLRLQNTNARLERALYDERQRETAAKAVLAMLNDPSVQRMTLVTSHAPATPHVNTYYQKSNGQILLTAKNMQLLPADKSYQLWLIPASGGAPMPAGLVRPAADGSVFMMHTMEITGIDAKSFAITIEPLHGSSTPTMPIVMAPAG